MTAPIYHPVPTGPAPTTLPPLHVWPAHPCRLLQGKAAHNTGYMHYPPGHPQDWTTQLWRPPANTTARCWRRQHARYRTSLAHNTL